MTDQFRIGLVGTGFIGRVHTRAARLAGASVAAVSASTPERSQLAAEALRAERAVASADELVTAADIDVVHICAPNDLHLPLALRAIAAGKHVICEKPLALDVAGAIELTTAAAAAGVVATVPFVYRYYPTVREARARIASGQTGAVRLVHGSYLQDWLTSSDDWNWRVDPARGGRSRAFADIGSHWCDLVEFVTGQRIVRLVARSATLVPHRTVAAHRESFAGASSGGVREAVATEDAVTLVFETDGGAIGSAVISQVSPGRKNRLWFEVDGADAAIAFDQEQPETLWVGGRDSSQVIARDPGLLSPGAARYATLPAGHPQGYQDCFDAFVADTYEAIRDGAPDGLPRFEDGLRAAQVTDAVLRSASAGTWVEVGT